MCAKANRTVRIIKHTFSRTYVDLYQILFKSLVRPILKNCSCLWSPCTNALARKIEQIKPLATKMVENLKDVSYSERLLIIGIQTIQFGRLRAEMIQAYKIFNWHEEIDTECFFTVDSDSHTRGHPFKLKKIRGNTMTHILTFSHRTVDDWNSFPSSLVLLYSVNCLKSRLNDAWKEHPLKFDADCFWLSCALILSYSELKPFLGRGGVIQVIGLLDVNKGEQGELSSLFIN